MRSAKTQNDATRDLLNLQSQVTLEATCDLRFEKRCILKVSLQRMVLENQSYQNEMIEIGCQEIQSEKNKNCWAMFVEN